MDIVLEPRNDRQLQQAVADRLSQALKLLEPEVDPAQFPFCQALAETLQHHTPSEHLLKPTPRLLADWIKAGFALLASRQGDVAVTLWPVAKRSLLLVINAPDAPYLLDSLLILLRRHDLRHEVIAHLLLMVRRRNGRPIALAGQEQKGPRESLIIVSLEASDLPGPEEIAAAIRRLYRQVLQLQADQRGLLQHLKFPAAALAPDSHGAFWTWLVKGNFLPLASCTLDVTAGKGRKGSLHLVENSRLGIAVAEAEALSPTPSPLSELPADFQRRILRAGPVVVQNVAEVSVLCRSEVMTYLGFREPLAEGHWREHAFWGLFSRAGVEEPMTNVPPLRHKLQAALKQLQIPADSHDYRRTMDVFNSFPKVEFFFMTPEELVETVRSFTLLYRVDAVKLVATRSLAVHGLTLLLIMPRPFYAPERLARIEAYLGRYFRTRQVAARIIHFSAEMVSLHLNIQPCTDPVHVDLQALERRITHMATPWDLSLRRLLDRAAPQDGNRLWRRYRQSFSREYRALTHPRFALRDILALEKLQLDGQERFELWGPFRRGEDYYRLQFYSSRKSDLNELMPGLENLNLRISEEVDFTVQLEKQPLYIKSFAIRGGEPGHLPLFTLRKKLLEALTALRRGEVENDYLHRLLVLTGLSWREIDIFRGYRNYYFQLGSPYTKRRVAFALINNPQVALLLFRYFEARFKPEAAWSEALQREEAALGPLRQELATALQTVTDSNEDAILRTQFNLIDSTVRTNFFVRWQRPDYFFAFKISAIGIIDMPVPRPLFEVYVHAADCEGIHLRGGRVARGGIRWSDRPDDFRTEILGLMKTQMTKNALIVPVGSKGGFVVKTPITSREQGAQLVKSAYTTLMRGLLDLTDNRVGDRVTRPAELVVYDEEDPYLVVAADKGTAHLPDTANAVSAEYRFWLGDAFASGGSQGYDHKKLGITARGAWEAVKRHFRELGRDIQTEPFTVVGIGDMSGDVFGNGMLLSRQIRLLAAFDHRHIFLDPDPDPVRSFAERQRLFALPGSSWADYDTDLISAGGGVFPRSAKDIPLSPQIRNWLGIRHESLDPPGLIRTLLGAEVDLLWNGGIGTYVKASGEKQEEAGDRANDGVRIDATQLRVRVVGEGGNLGLTQKARIEFALAGGRINTDAVDNSAGVDCSDHEVNLKILMQQLLAATAVADQDERDRLLQEVTDEVCQAVLGNNVAQSLCLSLDELRCRQEVEPYLYLADRLTAAGVLNRQSEGLPSTREVQQRQDQALTRPELSILMAYSKMQIFQALLDGTFIDQDGARDYLAAYFPATIRQRFGPRLASHPLAREITATVITNRVVDQAGCAAMAHLVRWSGAPLEQSVATYLSFDRILDGPALRQELSALDPRLSAAEENAILLAYESALADLCLWALDQNLPVASTDPAIADYRQQLQEFGATLGAILPEDQWQQSRQRAETLQASGLSSQSARLISLLGELPAFLPAVTLVSQLGSDLYSVLRIHNEIRDRLGLKGVLRQFEAVPRRDHWDRIAGQTLKKGFLKVSFQLTRSVFEVAYGNPEAFLSQRRSAVSRYRTLAQGLAAPNNYHSLTVLLRLLEDLAMNG